MDHAQDVERLFSWLKAPMLHYREFAPQAAVAEAVAAWPIVHRAAVQTGVAPAGEIGPHGDAAAREHLARERMAMPANVARALREAPLAAAAAPPPTPGRLEDRPAGDEAAAAPEAEPQPATQPAAARAVQAEQAAAIRREPVPRPEPSAAARPLPVPQTPISERSGLFAGEYRGREVSARRSPAATGRQDRSLDAVFARLSGPRDRLPDPRGRARTSAGLGAVFGRLR